MQLRIVETPTRLKLSANPPVLKQLKAEFSYQPPDYWRSPSYQMYRATLDHPGGPKGWDGWLSLLEFNRGDAANAVMFRGHKEELLRKCEELGIAVTGNWITSPFTGLTPDDVPDTIVKAKFKLDHAQKECVISLLNSGMGVVRMSVSAGKTVMFAALAAMIKERMPSARVLYVTPTERLVNQVTVEVKKFLPEWDISQAGGSKKDLTGKDMVVATMSMLANKKNLAKLHGEGFFKSFTALFVDECFPGTTRVGGKQISEIKIGDTVPSFNHATGRVETKRVLRTFKSKPVSMCRLTFSNGKSLVCTSNHPVFNGERYVPALLSFGSCVVLLGDDEAQTDNQGAGSLCSLWKSSRSFAGPVKDTGLRLLQRCLRRVLLLLDRVQVSPEGSKENYRHGPMQTVQSTSKVLRASRGASPHDIERSQAGECLLLRHVQNSVGERKVIDDDGGNESKIRLGQDETKESCVQSGGHEAHCSETKRPSFFKSGWKRHRADTSAVSTVQPSESTRTGSGDGTSFWVRKRKKEIDGNSGWADAPEMLLRRHRASCGKDRSGGGRSQPQNESPTESRLVENAETSRAWVVDVQILEQPNRETCPSVCPDGYVFNIEVEDNHNYFADGVLVHNCHHAKATTWSTVIRLCPALFRFGASDTVKDERKEDICDFYSIRGLLGPLRSMIDVTPLIHSGRVAKPHLHLVDIAEWDGRYDHIPHKAEVGTTAWCLLDSGWHKGIYKGGAIDETVVDRFGQPLELTGSHTIELPDRGDVDVESRWCLLERAYDVGVIRNKERNKLAVQWAQHFTGKGWPTLVVATRRLHVLILEQLMTTAGMDVKTLTGDDTTKERDTVFKWLMQKPGRVLVSPLVKEGVSLPELRGGVIADVVASPDLARQLIGRFIRKKPTGDNEAHVAWFIDRQYASARRNCLKLFEELERIRGYRFSWPCSEPGQPAAIYEQASFE